MVKRLDDDDILSSLEPSVALWFKTAFKGFTESQRRAIPAIMKNKNTLIFSQTGTGKTLAAFMAALSMLFSLARQGRLEDRVYVVYVSPLRALANDIRKNLLDPLEGIKAFGEDADIRVLVRSGDTPSYKRNLMLQSPPHILITTPETLAILLDAPRFSRYLKDVSYAIVDEIHALCDSKRGAHLSLSLERLQRISPGMVRIGLSATQAPVEEIARFLAGCGREADIVAIPPAKDFDLDIILPSETMSEPYEVLREKMLEKLASLILLHKTTIVFTNTRSGTESVVHALQKRGIPAQPHHGSMSREERLAVEDRLKGGGLSCVVTSTSLELGIDVGAVNLVVQIGSPKSVARALQRIGRAGHTIKGLSKARFFVFDKDDLIETRVLIDEARRGNIDRVDIPKNCLDVMAQHIVGMALEKEWHTDEAFKLIKKSYNYARLDRQDFENVLHFLSEKNEFIHPRINLFGKIFSAQKGSRMIYLTNIGTIPESSSFKVIHENGFLLGTLSESFVSRLSSGDIFVLGGKTLEFLDAEKERVFVCDASGKKPTIPSWSGEAMPRSHDLSVAIGRFRRDIFERLDRKEAGVGIIEDYISQQALFGRPTDRNVFVEQYMDKKRQLNLIFHSVFGRRINEALSFLISTNLGAQGHAFKTSICDDGFIFVFPRACDIDFGKLLTMPENMPNMRNTTLFHNRFRHVASRSLAVIRNWKGNRISLKAQKSRSFHILNNIADSHVLLRETENEILFSYMDFKRASEILSDIRAKKIGFQVSSPSEVPSPFALNILLSSKSDLVMLEEKGSLLLELQDKIYSSVFEKTHPLFSLHEIGEYFLGGEIQGEALEERVLCLLSRHGPQTLLQITERLACSMEEVESILDKEAIVLGYFVPGEIPQYMLLSDKENMQKKHGYSEEDLRKLLARKHFHGFKDAQDVLERYGIIGSPKAIYDRAGFFDERLVSARIAGKRCFLNEEDLALYVSVYRKEEPTRRELSALDGIKDGISIKDFLHARDGREILDKLEKNLYVIRRDGKLEACTFKPGERKEAILQIVRRHLSSCGPSTLEEIREACGLSYGEIEEALEVISHQKIRIFGAFGYDVFCLDEDVEALKGISSFFDRTRILDVKDPLAEKLRYELAKKFSERLSPIIRNGKLTGALDFEITKKSLLINDVLGDCEDPIGIISEIHSLFRFTRRKGVKSLRIKSLFGSPPQNFIPIIESSGFILEKNRLFLTQRKEISEEDFGFMLLKKGLFGSRCSEKSVYDVISKHLFMTEGGLFSRMEDFDRALLERLLSQKRICTMRFGGKNVLVADIDILLMNLVTRKEKLSDDEQSFLDAFPNPQSMRGYGTILEKLKRNNYILYFLDYERNDFGVCGNPDGVISRLVETSPPLTVEQVRNFTGLPHHVVSECLEKYPSYFSGRQVYTDVLLSGSDEGIMILDGEDPLSLLLGHGWDRMLKLPRGERKYILSGGVLAGGILLEEKEGKTIINDLVFFDEYKNHWLELLQKIQSWGDVAIKRINGKDVKSASGWG